MKFTLYYTTRCIHYTIATFEFWKHSWF